MDDLDKLPSLNVRALPRRATSSLADITNPNCCAPEETMTNERPSPIAPICLVVSAPNVMPMAVRVVGFVAALLFAITALLAFAGRALTPLSEPLPFFAYPFLVLTMCGWAWWCRRARL